MVKYTTNNPFTKNKPSAYRSKRGTIKQKRSNYFSINPQRLKKMINLETIMNNLTTVQTSFHPVSKHNALTTRRTMKSENHTGVLQWTVGNDQDDLEAISEGNKIPMEIVLHY